MSRRRVPRPLVIAIAAAILCVPAMAALGYQYIRDSQGRVVHLHRGVYEIYNGINATSGMQTSADDAITNWGNQLSNRDTVAVREVPGLTGAEVWFRDYDLPDAGAAVLWSEDWHQSSLPIDVVFDSSKESSWSQDTKQHKACNVIGNILGLADDDTGTDCMNPANSYPTVAPAGADFVDDFYGPNVSFANDLYTNRTNVDSSTGHALYVTASGHAIQSVTVKLDDTQIDTQTISPCDGTCSVGVSPNVGLLSEGTHTISATATNQFGQSNDPTKPSSSFTFTVAPNTVLDSGPNGPTNNARPTFTYHSATAGVTFQCRIDGASFAACPASGYTPSAALADGSHTFDVRANDAGHTDPSPASRTFTVDTHAPSLTASGDFTDHANPLVNASPLEDVTATDPGSGVAEAVLKIDGDEVATLNPDNGCAAPCSIDDGFLLELSDLAAGGHSYQIVATDEAGNSTTRSGPFVLDPSSPQIAVTGALADSSGGPLSSATATASIAASDNGPGDSGIASVDVTVDDETDQTYAQACAPGCPSTASASYTYSQSAWGPGPHRVQFTATDKAGNEQTTTLDVDDSGGDPVASCPTPQAVQQDPGQTVTATGAESQAIAPAVNPTTNPATDPDTGDTLDPTLTASDDGPQWMESAATLSLDEISQGPVPSVNVGDEICLVPTQTTSADTPQTEETTAGGDVQVYPNTATDTDTIVRPTVGGEAIIESIRAATAPSSYSFDVGIPAGDQLQQLANGGVAVVNPSQPAPPDESVPADPFASMSAQQVTSYLPDATDQLAEHNYSIANAEQETGHAIDAVIQPPETVDSQGNSTPSVLAVSGSRITVNVPSGTKAVVLKAQSKKKAPDIAPSWYVTGPKEGVVNLVGDFACTFAGWNGGLAGNRLLVYNFNNAAQFSPDHFGTNNGFDNLHNRLIWRALKRAAENYHGGPRCSGGGHVTFVYGNSNHFYGNNPFVNKWTKAGEAQKSVVNGLRSGLKNSESISAGGDLEQGTFYSGTASAINMAQGASGTRGGPYLDFGQAGGWGLDNLCDASYSQNGNRAPLPEIFNHEDARQWGHTLHYCNGKPGGHGYKFVGAYTGVGKGWQQRGFSSKEAWERLRHLSIDNGHAHIGNELDDVKG